MVKIVVDFVDWKHINEKWPKFAGDAHTINLRLALD
jgi:hypothetical protein